mgnify:CR=1 FL=1
MFTDMDKIDDNKIMMNTMDYNHDLIEYDDEEIVLQPNEINNSYNDNNSISIVEKFLIIVICCLIRSVLQIINLTILT